MSENIELSFMPDGVTTIVLVKAFGVETEFYVNTADEETMTSDAQKFLRNLFATALRMVNRRTGIVGPL